MKYKNFDLDLKNALNNAAKNVMPMENMLDEIKYCVKERKNMEEKHMKLNYKFKIAIVAAAVCAFSVTGYSIGKISSWTGHSSNEQIPYEKIEDMEKSTGLDIKRVESFDNGFKYSSAGKGKTKAYDDNGAVVGESNEISISYKNGNDQTVVLSARKTINGEDLSILDQYDCHKMVVFPGGAEKEVPQEEIDKYESEGYWISYGSVDKKEESTYESLYWLDGEILYSIGGINTNLGSEEMAEMKNAVLESK